MLVSLKIKVFILIATFFIILTTGHMFYHLHKSQNALNLYFEKLNKSSAKLLSENLKSNLYNLNFTSIKHILNYYDDEYIKNIIILNKEGYIIAQRNSEEIVYEKYKNFNKLLQLGTNNSLIYFQSILLSNKIVGYLIIENNQEFFEKKIKEERNEIIEISIILTIIVLLVSSVISIIITRPIENIIENIKNLDDGDTLKFKHRNDEFGYLTKEIEQSHKKINDLNNNLENKVKEELRKNKEKDKILQAQGLRASLGEMMDAVAHQWVQPLNFISLKSQELFMRTEMQDLDAEAIYSSCRDIDKQLEHLTSTLAEFRSFFHVNKKTEKVLFKKVIDDTLLLLKNDIIKNKIKVAVNCDQNEKVNIIPNEFKHVLINLINNSKDSFEEHKIQNKKINIDVYEKGDFLLISVDDNAGGISPDIIDDIFKANITSKKEGKGTGIGLYMSKMIIEKIGGSIDVENRNFGARFIISLKINAMS